jgi:hypothetical protein
MTSNPIFLELFIIGLLVASIAYVLWGRESSANTSQKNQSKETLETLLTSSPNWLIKPQNYGKQEKISADVEPQKEEGV